MKGGTAKKTSKTGGVSILIPGKLTSSELHDGIELYIASERLKGRSIKTKPAAVVDILTKHLGIDESL